VMFSVTSTLASGVTAISESNFRMRSCLPCASKYTGETRTRNRASAQGRERNLALVIMCELSWGSGRGRGRIAEADLGRFALGGGSDFKEFTLLETQHSRDDVGGELQDFGVEVADDGVVVAAGVLDGILNVGERFLERSEALNGAELRVSLGEGEEAFQRAGQHIFRLGLVGGAGGGHGAVARVDDGFEGALFVGGITLHGFDEIRDEIVAAFELHIDVRPGVIASDLQPDQAVVHRDAEDHQENEDAQNNKTHHWSTSFRMGWKSGNNFTIRAGGDGGKESDAGRCQKRSRINAMFIKRRELRADGNGSRVPLA